MKLLYSKPEFVVVEYDPQLRTIIGERGLKGNNKYTMKLPFLQLTYYKGLLLCTVSSKPLASMKEQVRLSILPNVFGNGVVCLRYGQLERNPKICIKEFWSSPFHSHNAWAGTQVLKKLEFKTMRDYAVKSQKEEFDPCKLNWPKPSELGMSNDGYYFKSQSTDFCLDDLPKMWEKDVGYKSFLDH